MDETTNESQNGNQIVEISDSNDVLTISDANVKSSPDDPEINVDPKLVKVNGMDADDKKETLGSPMESPRELENMTVVDEAVELLSSNDEEEKQDESTGVEGVENSEKKSLKRKTEDAVDETEPKKRNTSPSPELNGNKQPENDDKETTTTKPKEEAPKQLPLLEKYWKAVKDDPSDFTGWTYLLQYVDQANDVKAASEVYDDFLSKYPYCYGYWRKYADYLKKHGEKLRCEEVFEKGISAIPLSVDLWIHYLNYTKEMYAEDTDRVKNLFERSLRCCGLEFRSDRLWDAYVKWENDSGQLQSVTSIFDRWIAIPTQGYVTVMDKFKEHVKKNAPNRILDPDEFFTLRNEVLSETKAANAEVESKISDDAPPGEETPDNLDKMNEEETKALKEKIITARKENHKATQKEALARWSFEENIKRPYFHVKPLEQCQLNNWKEYLEFEIKEGNYDRITLLFERCLIACALYEEFWIKFTEYLLSQENVPVDKVKEVFTRACTIHHTKKLDLHMRWATFEEKYGNSSKAAEILENFEKVCPNVLMLMLRRLNVIRRRGQFEDVCSLYEHYINENVDNKEFTSSLSIKYARFCCKVLDNREKALDILKAEIEKDKNNLRLRLQLIDTYLGKVPVPVEQIVANFDEIIEADDDLQQKLLFAQRKLEFLDEFSDDCNDIQKAQEIYDAYVKLLAEKEKAEAGKRSEPNTKKIGAPVSDQTNQASATSVTATYPTTVTQTGYYPAAAAAVASPFQTYSQGYVTAAGYQQQGVYAQTDPNYPYQNWQTYQTTAAYNPTWPTATNPQPGPTTGYNNYLY